MRKRRIEHPVECRERGRIYAQLRREKMSDSDRENKKQRAREYNRIYYRNNCERLKSSTKQYRLSNLDRMNKSSREWRERNRAQVRRRQSIYERQRRASDPNFKLRCTLRRRLGMALSRNQKSGSALTLLGCSIPDFKIYLESKWEAGMTWENYGTIWHIDHIMPCAIFDLSIPDHQHRCFHFSNLQPLLAEQNWRKGGKVLTDQYPLL